MDDGAPRFHDERAPLDGTRYAYPELEPEPEPESADAKPTPRPALGATMGRFVILGTLGAGGMGVVHSAYDPELDRKIAIKLLKGAGAPTKARARLRREAQALARLNHPNVVTVYDVGVHAGGVFVAMEFIKGQTLGEWIREGPPERDEVLRVFRSAARGLAAAHETGLVHRDFKPKTRRSAYVLEYAKQFESASPRFHQRSSSTVCGPNVAYGAGGPRASRPDSLVSFRATPPGLRTRGRRHDGGWPREARGPRPPRGTARSPAGAA